MTIDTNCINTREADQYLNRLEEWHRKGLIEIVKTDVMKTEFLKANRRFTQKASEYREDFGVGVFDHSRWDRSKFYDPSIDYPVERIKRIVFPRFESLVSEEKTRAQRDIMHIATHHMHKRSFFVTTDKVITGKKEDLEKSGVVVLTPKQCVSRLSRLLTEQT